jgi:hypothetical protein
MMPSKNTIILFAALTILLLASAIWCVMSWAASSAASSRVEAAQKNFKKTCDLSREFESLPGSANVTSLTEPIDVGRYMGQVLAAIIPLEENRKAASSSYSSETTEHPHEGYKENKHHFTYANLSFEQATAIWYYLEKDRKPNVKINNIILALEAKTDPSGTIYTYRLELWLSSFASMEQ